MNLSDWGIIAVIVCLLTLTVEIIDTSREQAHIQETEMVALKETVLYLIETTQENKNAN